MWWYFHSVILVLSWVYITIAIDVITCIVFLLTTFLLARALHAQTHTHTNTHAHIYMHGFARLCKRRTRGRYDTWFLSALFFGVFSVGASPPPSLYPSSLFPSISFLSLITHWTSGERSHHGAAVEPTTRASCDCTAGYCFKGGSRSDVNSLNEGFFTDCHVQVFVELFFGIEGKVNSHCFPSNIVDHIGALWWRGRGALLGWAGVLGWVKSKGLMSDACKGN